MVAFILAGAVVGCTNLSTILAPPQLSLATGVPGGIYHPVGNAICRMFNLSGDHLGRPCVAVRSDGSVANVRRIQAKEAMFGLSQTDMAYAAFHGQGPFRSSGPALGLRMLIALYPEAFTVVARADTGIRDFADLRGKRIGIGMTGSGYTLTRDVILGFYGWTIHDWERVLELGAVEQNQELCDNQVDAIIFEAGHPDGLTQDATQGCDARLVRVAGLEVDRLLAAHSYYVASTIPGGMYVGNPDDTPTFGSRSVLIASSALPDDLAYEMVKSVFENLDAFRRLHPALAPLTAQDMVPSEAVIPIHPGALRYYRERGLIR
ncbi:hypothetical protein A6A04_19125 [Paramagnetospirillum marisnigri]|uniref:C4-dicarboxylate ABC transporter substrate-binding protein n=1 Tax=Paramagnetospirillum marisnigri TaxID=1285242 RepID=A0A178MNR6_9PROT|nr:hypothetical protein A6A04_19125 [Paramagnetospirillum marisnigri]